MGRPVKHWFDKRAADGGHWTVATKTTWGFPDADWTSFQERVRYAPVQLIDARNADIHKHGKMTKEEAEAMAKLLNASQTD